MPTSLTDTQLHEEYNQLSSFELCIHAQELIQDSTHKTIDFVNSLRSSILPSLTGDQSIFAQRKTRIDELLAYFEHSFQRLKVVAGIVHQRKLALEQKQTLQIEQASLPSDTQVLKQLEQERQELKEQLKLKNQTLLLAIEKVSDIIWQINSIQSLKQ
jgi:hypothetical protein